MNTLAESLPLQIERCKEALKAYEEIGPVGRLAYDFISRDIKEAELAILEGDTVAMLRSYYKLVNVKV